MGKQSPAEALAAHAARQRARRANRSPEEAARERLKDRIRKREAKKAETSEQAELRRLRNADCAYQRRCEQRAIADAWTRRFQQPYPPRPSDSTSIYELQVIPHKITTFVNACAAQRYTCLGHTTRSAEATSNTCTYECEAGHTGTGSGLWSIPVTLTANNITYTATIVDPAVAAVLYPEPNANPLDDVSLTEQRTRRLKLTHPVQVKATSCHRNHTTFITELEVIRAGGQGSMDGGAGCQGGMDGGAGS